MHFFYFNDIHIVFQIGGFYSNCICFLGIYFGLEPLSLTSLQNASHFSKPEDVINMKDNSAPDKLKSRLSKFFGGNGNFDLKRGALMKECALKELNDGKVVDWESKVGLIKLFEKSGGELTPTMKGFLDKVQYGIQMWKVC